MKTLRQISIGGFRRLASVQNVEIRPLTVLIGANGVGKTSFLDVFSLLSESAAGRMGQKISDLGGINSILTRGRAKALTLQVEIDATPDAPLRYILKLSLQGQSYVFSREELLQDNPHSPEPFRHIASHHSKNADDSKSPGLRGSPVFSGGSGALESSLSRVANGSPEREQARTRLSSLAYYAALDFDARRNSPVRLPQPLKPAVLPGRKGEDLVSCLYNLRETDKARFEAVEDALAAAFPGFESIGFPPVAAGTLAMTWKESDFREPIYTHELSEGTLRFLWLVTLLQSPGLTEITLIDEPEVSLHPDMLRLLVDLLREASQRTQLIVATQSERLVRFLTPEEVLICDTEDGATCMKWGDTLDLDKWLADYALDELWRMGVLGGQA